MINIYNKPEDRPEDRYDEFEQTIVNRFNSLVSKDTPLFTVNVTGLWDMYLNNIIEEGRQHYNCNCCRHFIERYGNLVVINETGTLESVLWSTEVPPFFKKSIETIRNAISKSRINGIFKSDEQSLGTPRTGEWGHLHATLPNEMVNRSRVKTAGQLMAEKSQEYEMLNRAIQEYPLETITKSIELLKTDTLYRADKVMGIANWFKGVCEDRKNATDSRIKENITWMYVAIAPAGFCHVRNSVFGTLLDSIVAGESFETLSRKFKEKMDPNNFMRSQVAPSEGNLVQAEKLIEKLGLANALRRRYVTFGELQELPELLWENNNVDIIAKEQTKKASVFGNIIAKGKTTTKVNNIDLPTSVMTWDKFVRTVLPTADNIEAKVDNADKLMALVTAADDTAENILLWDNKFSWYYRGGIDSEIRKRLAEAGAKYENNEIRCSLIWENRTDLDLHCITPSGAHMYFGTKRANNGWLDVDMNAGGRTSDTPVENIRWNTGDAPNGHYKFYVNNFNERVNSYKGTPFKVELEINGKIYSYEGAPLKNNERVVVFEFDYIKGQQPIIGTSSIGASSSDASDWNIASEFVKVNGITSSPNLWGEKPVYHSGNHTFFILEGCKDLSEGTGKGFFNEMLKSELKEIRKSLEAYTSVTPIEDAENASACGVGYNKDTEWNLTLRVTSNGSSRLIKIDRWD